MTQKMAKKKDDLTFEEALERLGEIVVELESESVNLDRSLDLFTEGQRLTRLCHDQLVEAEEKVTTLIQTAAGFQDRPGLPGPEGSETK